MDELTAEQWSQMAEALTKAVEAIGEFIRKAINPLIAKLMLIVAVYADASDRLNLGITERGLGWRLRLATLSLVPIRWEP